MAQIIPAIIAKDFTELKEKLAQVEGLAAWAQIDVMDGVFVPSTTWRAPEDLADIKTSVNLEAHLMIANPEKTIDAWTASSVKRILIHYESTSPEEIKKLIAKIHNAGKEVGIVLKLETPISVLDDLLSIVNCQLSIVQLMGIAQIGFYGHPLDERIFEKIVSLHEKYSDVIIEIDGGVNLENIGALARAGARNLVAGSAIFKSNDVKKAIEKFNSLIHNL